MTFNYSALAQTAQQILAQFGATTTLTRQLVSGTYDPGTGAVMPPAAEVNVITAAVFPVEDKMINGTTIRQGDQQAYISAQGLSKPRPGDVMAWGGSSYTVADVKALGPAGVFVLYEAIIRSV